MSVAGRMERLSVPAEAGRKGGTPLVCLTAHTTPVGRLADAQCDVELVGDSVFMVLHGLPDTLGVTLEMMILQGKAVRRGPSPALMVVDMPFGSYEARPEDAFADAARLMAETGCAAVKLEGGARIAATIRFLVDRGIPVMAHVGLTPRSVHAVGGDKVQGRGGEAGRVLEDALAVAQSDAFSIVLEKVPDGLARTITERVPVRTIGIGASVAGAGRILVVDDMLGLFTDFRPIVVRRYAELGADAARASAAYAHGVRQRRFPASEHVFSDEAAPSARGRAT